MDQEEKFQPEQGDEINLMDYVKVILRRKVFIFALFLAAVIAAGIFSFIMPKVYKIDTFLEVGRIGGATVEVPGQVKEKIDGDVYGVLIREKLNISEKKWPKIKAENPKDTNLLNIKIESKNPQQAKEILEEKNELILTEHQEKIKLEKELLEKNIATLENNIEILKKDIERIKVKISSLEEEKRNLAVKVEALQKVLPYERTPGTQFVLFDTKEKLEAKKQEIENRYLEINSLEIQINSLKNQIDNLRKQIEDIKSTDVVKSPTISESPIKPRPLLNIVIAAVLGLFIGTFLAFGREWWEKSKA